MDQFIYRTEDFGEQDVLRFFVPTEEDRNTVDLLKSSSPVVLEGSRGVGKSFLMKVAEAELQRDLATNKVFPVYVTFVKSSLVHTADPFQFRNWMLARICSRVMRSLRKAALLRPAASALSLLSGAPSKVPDDSTTAVEEIARAYEESWRSPGAVVDSSAVPDVEDFKDAIEDLCAELGVKRFCCLFDEAAHIFRPEQQRQFFTLFRDLRSPYITCNAAVYPGITSYGSTFQMSHDATLRRVERDVTDSAKYLDEMKQIILKQSDEPLKRLLEANPENFEAVAYAVHGNPRNLFKVISRSGKLKVSEVTDAIKYVYRTELWSDHSKLGEEYPGHRHLVDWGRSFVEDHVLKDMGDKNKSPHIRGRTEYTCYFWIHRDAPEVVKQALRLLEYMGLVQKGPELIKGTRSELGTRYAMNLGCMFAELDKPISDGLPIARNLSIKRLTEYGAKHPSYRPLQAHVKNYAEPNMFAILQLRLEKSVASLDITEWQKGKLKDAGLTTVGHVLKTTVEELDTIKFFGVRRSSQVLNAAMSAVLEYLSD
jgi:hypothetical protein